MSLVGQFRRVQKRTVVRGLPCPDSPCPPLPLLITTGSIRVHPGGPKFRAPKSRRRPGIEETYLLL